MFRQGLWVAILKVLKVKVFRQWQRNRHLKVCRFCRRRQRNLRLKICWQWQMIQLNIADAIQSTWQWGKTAVEFSSSSSSMPLSKDRHCKPQGKSTSGQFCHLVAWKAFYSGTYQTVKPVNSIISGPGDKIRASRKKSSHL